MKATAAPAGPELQALRNCLLTVLASKMLSISSWPGGRCSVLEQGLSQAGLGFCISAFMLLSSQSVLPHALIVLRSVLSFPGAVALNGDLHAALPVWAFIFLAVVPGFDPLQ